MKRIRILLDEQLLQKATEVLKARSDSEAVSLALEQAIQLEQMRGMAQLFGSGAWDGDLSTMREDKVSRRNRRAK